MPGTVKKTAETKNQKRRAAKKVKKLDAITTNSIPVPSTLEAPENLLSPAAKGGPKAADVNDDIELDSTPDISADDPLYAQFKNIFEKFQQADELEGEAKANEKPEVFYDEDDEIPDEEEDAEPKLSKKKRKEQSKLSVAELKALVRKPDLVEWTDTSAADPRLLVALKSYRNVVPVPQHWSLKREYLSSKRGVEKAPFALPKFIQETGIAEMRDAVLEKQEQASLKQKQRERVQPKMGKLDIDYQKLYEAFFRFQTKPEMTRFGEVYYEGKEYETNLRHLRPGELSEELKEALNIPPGAPPPWLINQQRFGPPPSYPALRISGLNAPPPPGGSWGFHPGGYGKPPVDEFNRPLYGGDIFGVIQPQQNQQTGAPVEKTLWGQLAEPEAEEEEDEEEEDDEDEGEDGEQDTDEAEMAAGMQTTSGTKSVSGFTSVQPSEYGGTDSVHTDFTLRKQKRGMDTDEPHPPRSAGQIIPEQGMRAQGFFGSDRGYDLKAASTAQGIPVLGQEENSRKRKAGDLDVSIDLDALQKDDRLSKEQLQKQYEVQRKTEQGTWGAKVDQDDLSDMIAQESSKRLKKDEERRTRR